jgi:hypothetical protein
MFIKMVLLENFLDLGDQFPLVETSVSPVLGNGPFHRRFGVESLSNIHVHLHFLQKVYPITAQQKRQPSSGANARNDIKQLMGCWLDRSSSLGGDHIADIA